MADNTSWDWNYFTLESMCKATCSLCDHYERPMINKQEPLDNHIRVRKDSHKKAYDKIKKFKKKYSKINWDKYYRTIQSTGNMLNPIVECIDCDHRMSIQAGTEVRRKTFLSSTSKMKSHLKRKHEVDESSWTPLRTGLEFYAGKYCNVTKLGKIDIYTCKECDNDTESRAKTGIMFVKHLLDKHRCDGKLDKFPWPQIPNELRSLCSTTLSSDIADRPGPSRLDDSNTSGSRSQKSPSKRKGRRPNKVVRLPEEHSSKRKGRWPCKVVRSEEHSNKRKRDSST